MLKPWQGYVWVVAGNITGMCGVVSWVVGDSKRIVIGIIVGGLIEILFGMFILVKTEEI